MNKICLIGNSGRKSGGMDGQTSKVRLYLKKIKDEGFDVFFVDLESFSKRPLRVLLEIKKAIKTCNRVILISAERGCRLLIPFINFFNKKRQIPFILPLVGTSVLHFSLDKLDEKKQYEFMFGGNFSLVSPSEKIKRNLSMITYILPETELLTDVYRKYYGLKNVVTLNNFRDITAFPRIAKENDKLKIIFYSRVMEKKGIFDIINACRSVENNCCFIFDIYGPLYLSKEEREIFFSLLDDHIHYLGVVDPADSVKLLASYDLMVFPTRFATEGTPGVIVESLIAGTPVLSSAFPQANVLLKNGFDSVQYTFLDKEDLQVKLDQIVKNRDFLIELTKNAQISGEKYTYSHERKIFLKYICGIDCEGAQE